MNALWFQILNDEKRGFERVIDNGLVVRLAYAYFFLEIIYIFLFFILKLCDFIHVQPNL